VTGIGSDGSNYLYAIGMGTSSPVVERFTTTGSHYTYTYSMPGLSGTHDCAYEGGSDGSGDIWVANDNATSPIRVYNSSGQMVGGIPATDVPDARGLCFESPQYLWVSDPTSDLIYRVDLSTGVGDTGTGLEERAISVSANPFYESVAIMETGFTAATVDIFDVTGRRVTSADIQGSYVWNGSDSSGSRVPAGTYIVRVSDDSGPPVTRSLVRL
jgi:hypothetical protein